MVEGVRRCFMSNRPFQFGHNNVQKQASNQSTAIAEIWMMGNKLLCIYVHSAGLINYGVNSCLKADLVVVAHSLFKSRLDEKMLLNPQWET